MGKIPKIDLLETIRAFGELKNSLDSNDNEFIKWVMRIGEARNILNNALIEFDTIKKVMSELEHNIPQYHKQPGNFRQFEAHINDMMSVLKQVNHRLSYIQDPHEDVEVDSDDDEDDEDMYE